MRGAAVAVIFIVLLAAVGYFGVLPWWQARGKWQAVFLANNQVYFGHLSSMAGRYLKLNDVYYLRAYQPQQSSQDNQQSPPDLKIVQLGGEPHGPESVMFINRDNILFWEHLKDDSGVLAAIKQLKEQQRR